MPKLSVFQSIRSLFPCAFISNIDNRVIPITTSETPPSPPHQVDHRQLHAENQVNRRRAVFTNSYDPDEEEEDEVEIVNFPKTQTQREFLQNQVKDVFVLQSCDKFQLDCVIDAMFLKEVQTGDHIIHQGENGDYFYVINSGIFNIFIDDKKGISLVGSYDNGGYFGDLALMYDMPRSATIVAASDGSLYVLDGKVFRNIVLKAAHRKRLKFEKLLRSVPLLEFLTDSEILDVADALTEIYTVAGEKIIQQNELADGMYFIEEGEVRVAVRDVSGDGGEIPIARLGAGKYFGELALVTEKTRSASIYATTNVRLAFLNVEAFERLLGPCRHLMQRNAEQYKI